MNGKSSPQEEIVVHGLDLSYFTGKIEAYLRMRGQRYRLQQMDTRAFRRCARATGVAQMPQLELPNGAWLTDTPLIVDAFEAETPLITPSDPCAAFIAHLLEDYGDEWLWRPALYYRWRFTDDARLMSARLARGMLRDIPAPFFLRRLFILARQRREYLLQDGVNARTEPSIEALYLDTLDALNTVLGLQPFILGARPTRADLGFFGGMFRHFSSDPTPAALMRARAPHVLAWVGRIWAIAPSAFSAAPFPHGAPSYLQPIVTRMSLEFLPYMAANDLACAQGCGRVVFEAGDALFDTPVNPYRAWRFQRLLSFYDGLDTGARAKIDAWLGGGKHFSGHPRRYCAPSRRNERHVRDRQWRD